MKTSLTTFNTGSVIRIGPNTLDFDTSTAQTAIHRDRHANLKKADWYKTLDASNGAYSVQSVPDKKEHAFRRRVIAPGFTEVALREQEPLIDYRVRVFLEQLSKSEGARRKDDDGWSAPHDMSLWSTYYGLDFISDLSFGSSFDLLRNAEHRYVPDLLRWTSHFVYYVRPPPPLPAPPHNP